MTNFKPVSGEEFAKFLLAYPRTLERDVTGISDPPLVTYNDFTLGNWPESVVAKCSLVDEDAGEDAGYSILCE